MQYNLIDLQEYLQNHHTREPTKEVLQSFENNLSKLLKVNANESEEHQKIALMDFLKESFSYECNTKNRIDLSIYEDNKAKVLFEVKSLKNEVEFIASSNGGGGVTLFGPEYKLECKAFYESILYFLREYKTHNNNDLKYIILTNTRDFYLIEAREYLTFANDKTILKAFDNCDRKEGTDTSTQKFYATLKDYLPSLDSTLKFTYFDIKKAPKALLYQILSPQVLLKQKAYIDANTLNQDFYDELLYILGLQEVSQNSKILITPTTQPNTLLDSICSKLGLDRENDFEIIFSLLTTWNNRILFLRLLESMLVSFKHINKSFLDSGTLKNFTDLNTLFFDILALKKEKRKTDLKLKDSIPYLNSSLFDKTELEKQNKEISRLDSKHLAIFKHSILKKDKDYTDTHSLPLLEYLFAFLHAYDFTTTPKDIIDHTKTNYDKLINAAVLGLVFEKLNGYKEGSFYTPSFITSYMCKESLEKVVIDKFNAAKSWECDSLESLTLRLDKLTDSVNGYKEANEIFDSIRVCDPAVGSGHFLVSMLNAMIELKFRLKILCEIYIDSNGEAQYKLLKNINLSLENDEIVIQDSNNTLHSYQTPAHQNIESHIIQKALFNNKRILIESCLFGVDINPNSCEITKLRLWIELLKYSFYIFDSNGNTNTLETLPNIDINIKCGNSLISNIALDMTKESLEKDLKSKLNDSASLEFQDEFLSTLNDIQNKLPRTIQAYKDAVKAYKDETTHLKQIHKQTIEESQRFIIAIFHKTSKAYQNFKNILSSYLRNYGYAGIDHATLPNKNLDSIIKSLNSYIISFNFHKSLDIPKEPKDFTQKDLITIIDSMQEYENLINDTNAFEWRFAFPEVLDKNGDFIGFDLVIGNPPYIRQEEIKHLKPQLQKASTIYKGTSDIYTYFYEQGYKILKHNGILSFITSNKYCRAEYGEPLREFLLEHTTLLSYTELNGIKVFDSASVDTSILSFIKTTPDSKHTFDYAHPKDYDTKANTPLQEYITKQSRLQSSLLQSSLSKEGFIFLDSTNAALKAKIETIGTPLKEWDISIYRGVLTGYNEAFIIDSAKRDEILSNCDDSEASLKPFVSLQENSSHSSLRGSGDSHNEAIHKNKAQKSQKVDSNQIQSEDSLEMDCHDSAIAESRNDKGEIMLTERERTRQLIKPILRGRDIKRYSYEWAGLWIIFISWHFPNTQNPKSMEENETDLAEQYPSLYNHLSYHKERLSKRNKDETGIRYEWYCLQRYGANYHQEFAKPKIIYPNMAKEFIAHLDTQGFFTNQKCFILTDKNGKNLHYLTAILNSKANFWYFKQIGATLGASGYEMSKIFVEKLPIPKAPNPKLLATIEQKVCEMLESKRQMKYSAQSSQTEKELDSLIYQLYGLDEAEITLIESSFKARERERERERLAIIESLYHFLESFIWDYAPTPSYQGKILYPCIMAKEPCFIYEEKGFFAPAPANLITGQEQEMKYLTGLLNSTFIYFAMRSFYMGGGIEGELKTNNLLKLPIPQITESNKPLCDEITAIVGQILETKAKDSKADTQELESQIDSLVYKLYNLTNDEINTIEKV